MRAKNKVLLTMGSAMLISAGAAMAGPPGGISYGGFTATNGIVTAACPTGATCGTPITGNGFLQRSLVVGGQTYFQTIVLPTGANVASAADLAGLSFADENFVQQGGGTGIADNQNLFAAGTVSSPGNFAANTQINSGWAQGTGSVIALSQSIVDTAAGFNLNFSMAGNGVTATSLSVSQNVSLASAQGPSDLQKFDLRQLTEPTAGNNSAFALPGGAGSIAWNSNDIIQAVWMGQSVTTGGTTGQMSGFQGYSNITSGATVSYTDQTTTGPWNYDTTDFGTAPTFP